MFGSAEVGLYSLLVSACRLSLLGSSPPFIVVVYCPRGSALFSLCSTSLGLHCFLWSSSMGLSSPLYRYPISCTPYVWFFFVFSSPLLYIPFVFSVDSLPCHFSPLSFVIWF